MVEKTNLSTSFKHHKKIVVLLYEVTEKKIYNLELSHKCNA
jgi:hypothetical protein